MIYLDYQATTPLAPEAREAMLRWLGGADDPVSFANPHSPHRPGRAAAAAVERAREQVAALLPSGGKVIFTSGATEAINLAIRGSGARTFAASAIEHAAVLDTVNAVGPTTTMPVDKQGVLATDADTGGADLVCVMKVNNEIGTIQPVEAFCDKGSLVLCDAVQAAGKMILPPADYIAVSAHKLNGPKGIGALWVRDGAPLSPVQTGGGQEQGLRSGTLSPALCAGFGVAAELAASRRDTDLDHVDQLWRTLRAKLDGWTLNGSEQARYKGNLNVRREGIDVGRLMSEVREVAFSAGSACASGSGRPSHVLSAIGLTPAQAKSSLRLGFGRYTTIAEVEKAAELLNAAVALQEADSIGFDHVRHGQGG